MTRLSREQKRELKRAGRAPAPAGLTPIDVRVSVEAGATVGGMPVPAAAGESLQTAALDYLHRLALATGHPVLATVHDERIGYVVPLQVHVDGSSRFAGEPVQVAEPRGDVTTPSRPAPAVPPAPPVAEPVAAPPAEPVAAPVPRRDKSTYVLRAVPESAAQGMTGQEPTAPESPHAQPQGHAQSPSQQAHSQPQRPQGYSHPQPHVPEQAPAPQQAPVQAQPHSSEPQPQQSQPQAKREPSTMRLAAVEPTPSTSDPVGHPVTPERPKREPSTLPLTAAKATAPGQEAVGAPAEPPAAAEPKREPRTMPLTAAKPAAGGVAPSTFVLRAVPEPKDGPLARPPRGGTTQPAPAAGEYGGAAAEPAGTAGPEVDAYSPAGADSGAAAAPLTGEYGPVAAQSAGVAVPTVGEFGPARAAAPTHMSEAAPSHVPNPAPAPELSPSALEPQPWPPGRSSVAAQTSAEVADAVPAQAPAPAPAPELSPAALEPQPWPPHQAPVHQAPAHTPEAKAEYPAVDAAEHVSAHPSDAVPESGPVSLDPQPWPPAAPPTPLPAPVQVTTPEPALVPAPPEESAADPYSAPEWKVVDEDPGPKPAPVREFDAVAESVLDLEESDGAAAPSPFAEPVSRINEAVKMGRIQEAAEMAEHTVAQATATLGPQHAEVLRLRELTAYIAYLAGDALRSFHLSLDLAALRHRLRDPRAAYGNIQSAAAAWRAIRDPLQGLHLGRDLIAVWAELAADAGPAADDVEQLEKARTRMGRLAERARALDADPYARSPHAHGR
ncbi:tetratricopeptide repeat protein [Streptomyces sp. MA5143a]|uniref:tetratricopeptide repeat protein n=1 Tax=Streptomyces sp. MA5143a TaxID=2083010 RepID=UPI000D1B18E1|nr:tetratricopeptide repeat protein [Streptomyces sp. MA5143a]SPF07217.1 putative endonuclease containing a URI domain protein [Streptomyces sp. MA5143a]